SRCFLNNSVLASACVSLAVVFTAVLLGTSSPNPIQLENAKGGTEPAAWLPPAYPATSIEGYASELSVIPGEQVHFHVSSHDGYRYRIEVYRLGWYGGLGARLLTCLPGCSGDEAARSYGPQRGDGAGAGWPVTDSVTVP